MELQEARIALGKTQKQVAEESGVTERTYLYYEAGDMEPGVRKSIRIAEAVNVEVPDNFKRLWEQQSGPDGGQT